MAIREELKSGKIDKATALKRIRQWQKDEPYNDLEKLKKWVEKYTPVTQPKASKKTERKKKKRVRKSNIR